MRLFPERKQGEEEKKKKNGVQVYMCGFPSEGRCEEKCTAQFTRCRMTGIVFVRVQCETLRAIPLMLGGNDSD